MTRLTLVLVLVAALLATTPRPVPQDGHADAVSPVRVDRQPSPSAPRGGAAATPKLQELPGRLTSHVRDGGLFHRVELALASSSETQPAGQHQPTCVASWFGENLRGAVQASGIPFDPDELVAAMWDVPFGTEVLVEAPATGRSVVVAITDRGPAHRLGRCIDLSAAAFAALTDLDVGLVDVVLHTPTDDEEHHHAAPGDDR